MNSAFIPYFISYGLLFPFEEFLWKVSFSASNFIFSKEFNHQIEILHNLSIEGKFFDKKVDIFFTDEPIVVDIISEKGNHRSFFSVQFHEILNYCLDSLKRDIKIAFVVSGYDFIDKVFFEKRGQLFSFYFQIWLRFDTGFLDII